MWGNRRGAALSIVVGVLIGACGGGEASDSAADTLVGQSVEQDATVQSGVVVEDSLMPSEVEGASSRIFDTHGSATGFALTVVALNEGYSVSQIVDARALTADGAIDGVQPAGPSLGLLTGPAQPGGFLRAAPRTAEVSVLELRVEFLGATLNDIHGASFQRIERERQEAVAEAREGLGDAEYQMIYEVMFLVGRGYTLEQAMEGIFFGTTDIDGLGCIRLADEEPRGTPIAGALSICPNLATDGAEGGVAAAVDDGSVVAPVITEGDEPTTTGTTSLTSLADGRYPAMIDDGGYIMVIDKEVTFAMVNGQATLSFAVTEQSGPGDCLLTSRDSFSGSSGSVADTSIILTGTLEKHFALAVENCGDSYTSADESMRNSDSEGTFTLDGSQLVGRVAGFLIAVDLSAAGT